MRFVLLWYNKGMQDYWQRIVAGETGDKFAVFYRLLCEYNQKFNLTRIVDERECRIKHFYDSLLGEEYFPAGARCAEIGSGGGFPSVPLCIVRPDLSFLLVESVKKKCEFLRVVVRELGLNAQVCNARAEDLARDAARREQFDVCCARAVARLNTLAEYCLPFVRPGGLFMAYKGDAAAEIEQAKHAFSVLGAELASAKTVQLPDDAGLRTLVVANKVRSTPRAYPRGNGKERSRPL